MSRILFKNQELDIFKKGDYQEINRDFISEANYAIQPLIAIQNKYNKLDNDSFFNELKDGMVGAYLDYDLINIQKHGFDAKNSQKNTYLEVKQVSFSTTSWGATFNDTTYEKAKAFEDEKLFLAVGVWAGLSELLFIVYGQNPLIGQYLKQRIDFFKSGKSVRSTQSISVKKLVQDCGFKILTPVKTKKEIQNIFRLKYKGEDWWTEAILDE
ncbi:MAG: hypothetical protein IJR46_03130 [Neisseriaceae bacterium]|nr:hypothetical protein [Neisseriaceae bacterium]